MLTVKSKSKPGTVKNQWKIQQCQCERDYFEYRKNCDDCEGREYCDSTKFRPYYIVVAKSMLVFADSYDNAKDYASQGHGWMLVREGVDGIPIDVNVKEGKVSLVPEEEKSA